MPLRPNQDFLDALNESQTSGMSHPYTCPRDGTRGSIEHPDTPPLVATKDGWVCPHRFCSYRQDF